MTWRLPALPALVGVGLVALVAVAAVALAQPPAEPDDDPAASAEGTNGGPIPDAVRALRRRLVRLRRVRGAEEARGALAQARLAIEEAALAYRQDDRRRAERAEGIADAALILADRIAARARARHARASAERGLEDARRRAQTAREALARELAASASADEAAE